MGVQLHGGMGDLSIAMRPSTLALAGSTAAIESTDEINHFAIFMPAEGVKGVQVRLAAWGRPRMLPDSSSPYGYDGPLFPADFGLSGEDFDGADSHRVGLAIASFQRWANQADAASGTPLRTDGIYDLATDTKLRAVTPPVPAVPTVTPTNDGTSVVVTPPPNVQLPSGNVIPGPWQGSGSGSSSGGTSNQLPSSVPGNVFPYPSSGTANKPADKPIWPWLAIGAGLTGLVVVGVVVRRRRRRSS